MQVVHGGDAGQGQEGGADRLDVHAARCRVNGQVDRVLQQAPGADQDDRNNDDADQGVDDRPARDHDYGTGDDHADRDGRVGHHVQIGPARVQVAVLVAHEHQGGAQVDDEADCGDTHDQPAHHRGRFGQAADGFEGDGPAGEDQQQGVGEGGQHRGLAVAIGLARSACAPRQPGRTAGHGQAHHIGQIVPRIGHQGG